MRDPRMFPVPGNVPVFPGNTGVPLPDIVIKCSRGTGNTQLSLAVAIGLAVGSVSLSSSLLSSSPGAMRSGISSVVVLALVLLWFWDRQDLRMGAAGAVSFGAGVAGAVVCFAGGDFLVIVTFSFVVVDTGSGWGPMGRVPAGRGFLFFCLRCRRPVDPVPLPYVTSSFSVVGIGGCVLGPVAGFRIGPGSWGLVVAFGAGLGPSVAITWGALLLLLICTGGSATLSLAASSASLSSMRFGVAIVGSSSAVWAMATLSAGERGSAMAGARLFTSVSNSTSWCSASVCDSVSGASGDLGDGCFKACTMSCKLFMMISVVALGGKAKSWGNYLTVFKVRVPLVSVMYILWHL
jgi:hypothetical protein